MKIRYLFAFILGLTALSRVQAQAPHIKGLTYHWAIPGTTELIYEMDTTGQLPMQLYYTIANDSETVRVDSLTIWFYGFNGSVQVDVDSLPGGDYTIVGRFVNQFGMSDTIPRPFSAQSWMTGIYDVDVQSVKSYFNKNYLRIDASPVLNGEPCALYNLLGEKIVSGVLDATGATLPIGELPKGIYLIVIGQGGQAFTQRLYR